MSRVELISFTQGSCPIPMDLAPTTYRLGITRRWLYFIDRSQDNPTMNLRDLVLLPCSPDEIGRLYCVTLGLKNAPGATAAGTKLMREFGLDLKYEQAYDSCSGDIGSKTCTVVFRSGQTPKDFDAYVIRQVEEGRPGCHLIRKANEKPVEVEGSYSSEFNTYFGRYAQIRRYLPSNVFPKFIDKVLIQDEAMTVHETPSSMALRLTDAQRWKVEKCLEEVYEDELGLEGRFLQVSCDANFEALSFSFLSPDDILCWLRMQFSGGTDKVSAVVNWLGERGVDFRQYHIIQNESESGYNFRLLCDLAQTDLHLFDSATLTELLSAELDSRLSSPMVAGPGNIHFLEATYKTETLTLYNEFTERHRFRLLAVVLLDAVNHVVQSWPQSAEDPELLEELAKAGHDTGAMPKITPSNQVQRRSFLTCRHSIEPLTIAAVYDNHPPKNFKSHFRHFCQQPLLDTTHESLAQLVRKHLLLGLRYDLLSREEFEALGNRDRESFRNDNDKRFSSLGWNYIVEKWERDKFAFRGNLVLAGMIENYLTDSEAIRRRLKQSHGADRVRILDVGPGVGALTTALAIRRNTILWENLDRVELVFLDAAQKVLDLNLDATGYRGLPRQLLEDLQLFQKKDLERFISMLQRATHLCYDISDPAVTRKLIERENVGSFDIIYSGFCHHHMNRAMKASACQAMVNLAKEFAFVGVVDESFTYKQYLRYGIGHSLDQVGIATESYFQSVREHMELFGDRLQGTVSQDRKGNKFYAFWGKACPIQKSEPAPMRSRGEIQQNYVAQKEKEKRELAALLRNMERISLSEKTVIGKYLRSDSKVRHALQDWVRRIEAPLLTKTRTRENFLIWAAPGSGKTFLIQQIADSLRDSIDYVECNLAKDERSRLVDKLNSLSNRTRPVLCLLDEIDALRNEDWPYEECFPKLDLNTETSKQVVIVLVGSTENSVELLAESMNKRHKGRDLVNRISLASNSFEIPRSTREDSVTMAIGQIFVSLDGRVKSVEKLALFYILSYELLRESPRQLSEFVKAAATRFQDKDDRLRFHHLFRREDLETSHEFLKSHEGKLLEGLKNVDVQVSW